MSSAEMYSPAYSKLTVTHFYFEYSNQDSISNLQQKKICELRKSLKCEYKVTTETTGVQYI